MSEGRPDPDELLAAVSASEEKRRRGRLKIFLGANAGVGKTYAMLSEARTLRAQGHDVVIGLVETHGRSETAALAEGLERLPLKDVAYQGKAFQDFNLEAALARRPVLLLVDELAHSNVAGLRHQKRWQDIEELIAAGINVYTTVNVQHLESLNDQIARLTGVQVWETVPDRVVAAADAVELVDVPPEELLARLHAGKIYQGAQAERAAENFFKRANLVALRELALRETAARVDSELQALRQGEGGSEPLRVAERVLVCVGPDAMAPVVVRSAARLAAAMHARWTALYVETPRLSHLPSEARERVLATLKLAEQLGADTVTLGSVDIARTILEFAKSRGITRIVIGKPTRQHWLRRLAGSLVDVLVTNAQGFEVHLVAQQPAADFMANRGAAAGVAGLAPDYKWRVRWRRFPPAAFIVALATAVAVPLYPEVPAAGLVMIYLLAVVLVGLYLGRAPAAVAALLAGLTFNYLFTLPRFSLHIDLVDDVLTFIALLVVGLLIGELAARTRRQTRIALQREERAVALAEFTESLLAAQTIPEIAELACNSIANAFDAEVAFLARTESAPLAQIHTKGMRRLLASFDESLARWVFDRGEPAGIGTDTLPSGEVHYVPARSASIALAVLAIRPASLRRLLLPEPRRTLDAYARQVAIACERVYFMQHAREAELAIQAEDLRNALLSGLSHDLRTPLAAIIGSASALLENDRALGSPAARELVATIADESTRMSRMTSDLLDMARLTSGRADLRKEWIPLGEMIGGVRNRLAILLKDRDVTVTIPADLPLLEVDGRLFEQLLQNYLENAARYSPPGTPVEIAATADVQDVRIRVLDRGPGVPLADQQRIFEKFFRGAPEPSQGGVGLGLALCQAIATLHGGRVWVEDRPGGGSAFCVSIPRGDEPPGSE
ncbi:MAG TPA: sensor histidine kinase KdpD [Steroidobacteraceae bacterium]|nr:sensor histidine kinase KdpD [Steroidobacteraceae bacterium]